MLIFQSMKLEGAEWTVKHYSPERKEAVIQKMMASTNIEVVVVYLVIFDQREWSEAVGLKQVVLAVGAFC